MNPRYPTSARYRRHRRVLGLSPTGVKGGLLLLGLAAAVFLFFGDGRAPVQQAAPVVSAEPVTPDPAFTLVNRPEPPVTARQVPVVTRGTTTRERVGESGVAQPPSPMLRPPPPKPHRPDLDLRFYRELSQKKVILPPDPVSAEMSDDSADPAEERATTVRRDHPLSVNNTKVWTTSRYIVQLAAFPDFPEAESMARSLESQQAPVQVIKIWAGSQRLYQVQLGPFLTRADAARAALRWKIDDQAALIMRNPLDD